MPVVLNVKNFLEARLRDGSVIIKVGIEEMKVILCENEVCGTVNVWMKVLLS